MADFVHSLLGGFLMFRRFVLTLSVAVTLLLVSQCQEAQAQERAFARSWGGQQAKGDWNRFYHYPYVYYPQNYWGNEYYRSSESMYYRYPAEMRIPVYNKSWHNYYPKGRRYHWGHHFITDIF